MNFPSLTEKRKERAFQINFKGALISLNLAPVCQANALLINLCGGDEPEPGLTAERWPTAEL